MAILSRRPILLAILLYEQFLHLTKINLHPNTQLWSTQKHAHQSILVTSLFDSVCVTVAFWVNFKEKHFFMNMNISSLTIMYDSIFAQMYIFLIEKYFFAILVKSKICKEYQKYLYLGQNAFIYCSRITVVHVHVNILILKSHSMPL